MKYSNDQWQKLTREEKREALLKFQEPDSIFKPYYVDQVLLKEEKN